MFVFSFKASTLKYIGVMSLCTLAIVLTALLVPSNSLSDNMSGVAVEASAQRKPGDFKNVSSNKDRIAFLESFGWQVDSEPVYSGDITVPEEFDSVYSEYNKLQKKIGLDLEKYKGEKAKIYTYAINNAEERAFATLIVCKSRVIGGDVSSAKVDGFRYCLSGK